MPQFNLQQPVLADARIYVRARWFFALVLAALTVLDLEYPGGQQELWLYVALIGGILATSAALTRALGRGFESLEVMIRRTLIVDLACVAGFTYLLVEHETGFLPLAILLAAAYALIMPKRSVTTAGFGFAAAYLLGHFLGHTTPAFSDLALQLLSAASVVVLSIMVSSSVERRREREEETREAVHQREQALHETQRRVAELQAVSQITETIHSSLDFERVGPLVLDILGKVIGIDTCCLFVIDKDRSETLFTASIGAIAELPRYGADMHPVSSGSEDHFSCIAPFDHANIMVLFCADAEAIEELSEDDRLVLNAVASELVVAVENSRLYKLTKRLAITDELTGLANYRHLQSRIDREIERSRRYDKHFSLLMLDVDEFKAFNDSQGHVAGDAALSDLARVMGRAVREVDLVARYGGEEFSFVLPETDAAGAFVVAEKIREAVAEHLFPDAKGQPSCHLTVSLGLATYPTHGTDRESLLRDADDALYRAKNGGKNRVRTPQRRTGEEDRPPRPRDAGEMADSPSPVAGSIEPTEA